MDYAVNKVVCGNEKVIKSFAWKNNEIQYSVQITDRNIIFIESNPNNVQVRKIKRSLIGEVSVYSSAAHFQVQIKNLNREELLLFGPEKRLEDEMIPILFEMM